MTTIKENAFNGSMAETIGIVFREQVHGEVEFNDGEFAEIQTVGIEGIEKDLLLQTIQVHRGGAIRVIHANNFNAKSWLGRG
jgi:hypothetical protein